MKPIIGLTTFINEKDGYNSVSRNYINSVYAAGGMPVNIPIVENEKDYDAYLGMLDGIIFTGGGDISPRYYGENPLRQVNAMSSIRDEWELGLFKKAYEKNLPMIGICRGIQLINVALGGSLYQDINEQIPSSLGHYPKETQMDELYHSVNILKESDLYHILGLDKIYVNSFHHQSVKILGSDLAVAATSEDGIIEGIEATDSRFLIGVQWHPEALSKRYPIFLELFKKIVSAARI